MNYLNFSNDTFIGQYVSSYDDVISIACPFNGQPLICADLNNMMLYSKKNVNGIPTIQPYKLTPIYQEATKPQQNNTNDVLNQILNRLEKLEERNEHKLDDGKYDDGTVEKQQS